MSARRSEKRARVRLLSAIGERTRARSARGFCRHGSRSRSGGCGGLTQNGYPIPVSKPRRVTVDDMQKADVVVSLGCDLKDVPPGRGKLLTWNDVPGPSENFAGATETIRKHAEALVEELVRATR